MKENSIDRIANRCIYGSWMEVCINHVYSTMRVCVRACVRACVHAGLVLLYGLFAAILQGLEFTIKSPQSLQSLI